MELTENSILTDREPMFEIDIDAAILHALSRRLD